MINMEDYANRNLLSRSLKDGSKRGIEHHYYSFAHGQKPSWWNDQIPFAGKAFAVYENNLGNCQQAIVFTEELLAILDKDGVTAARFEEFERLILPTKDPVSLSLKIVLRSGTAVELPVTTPVGIAFDMYRFLLSALNETRRRKKLK
jgi:hypothetical protein